jgi:hypothetical protein
MRFNASWVASRTIISALVLALAIPASAKWKEKVLYSFQGTPDGQIPTGAIVFDKAGNLYGTTQNGGASTCASPDQCGTVFQLSPPTKSDGHWSETVLYVFKGNGNGDGASPQGGLVIDKSGNLYGTTAYGGTGTCVLLRILVGCGTVFELSPPETKGGPWVETVLYSFNAGKDGYVPHGDLTFDNVGNLYGATLFGGTQGSNCDPFYQGCGTVFKLSPPKQNGGAWKEKVLHAFPGIIPGHQTGDGAAPNGGLILDSNGAIYGTTYYGGSLVGNCPNVSGTGCGTVYKLVSPKSNGGMWKEEKLHVFKNGGDSRSPAAGLTFDPKGNPYGTTIGTVFYLTPPMKKTSPWKEKILYQFTNDGWDPQGALILDSKGVLYGTTYSAQSTSGTVFRLTPPRQRSGSWAFDLLYGFAGPPDGAQPAAVLVFGVNGNLYGTTTQGGTGNCSFFGCGTVFQLTP